MVQASLQTSLAKRFAMGWVKGILSPGSFPLSIVPGVDRFLPSCRRLPVLVRALRRRNVTTAVPMRSISEVVSISSGGCSTALNSHALAISFVAQWLRYMICFHETRVQFQAGERSDLRASRFCYSVSKSLFQGEVTKVRVLSSYIYLQCITIF